MKIRPNNVKLAQIRNSGPIKPSRWKHTKNEQLSTKQLSNGYTKASRMKENNDSSIASSPNLLHPILVLKKLPTSNNDYKDLIKS